MECRGFESHLRQLIFLRKSDCLGCAGLLCLVCLTLLASFFLPSSSLIKHVLYIASSQHLTMLSLLPCLFLPLFPSPSLHHSLPPPSPLSGMYVWPTLADVNTRARRLVSAWVKHQKKEEQKQVLLIKVNFKF